MNTIISSSIEIMKTYVYSDIILIPPEEDYYPKLNITEELNKMNITYYRPFYEFYRDYRKTMNLIKDINLLVLGEEIKSIENIQFSKYSACLPFKFRMDYDENNDIKIFISEFTDCISFYDQEIKEFIKDHVNISLISINDIDPFDYIQNFGKDYYDTRNPHGRFSLMLRNIHCFFLNMIPLNKEELSGLKLIFGESEKDILKLDYYIIKPNEIFGENELKLIDIKDFDEYFKQEMKGKQGFGNIFEIKNKFLKSKNLYNNNNLKEKEEDIKWDYESDNKGLKCKADSANQLNIFLQTSFQEDDLEKDFNFIIKCIELFYSNDYKIVGIESNTLSGSYNISYILTQLLQPKIYLRYNLAQRKNSFNEFYFKRNKYNILNPDTCLPFNNYEDFICSETDYYGKDTFHSRTKIYNIISQLEINKLTKEREKLLKEGFTKKPTDIIIFTDYISSGAAGLFIKSLQNNGGAIIAGYLGNPKIKENYDSTETVSLYENFKETDIYNHFHDKGFDIKSLAYAELFDKEYKNEQKTLYPMEFKKNKVDERTDIIHEFNYNSYNEFISKAKTIFKKYNEDKKCSNNNPNLLYEDNNCYEPDKHLYGGYICENGVWSNICNDLYCDVGYYYNWDTRKCEKDPCLATEHIILNFEGEKEYQIMPNKSYILEIQSPEKVFSIQSPKDNLILKNNLQPCPRFCATKNTEDKFFYVNYLQQISEPIIIKVTGIVTTGMFLSYKYNEIFLSQIKPVVGRLFYIIQLNRKEYGYLNSFDIVNKMLYAEYNDNMSLYDVDKINTEYFKEVRGKVIDLVPEKIYIIAISASYAFVQIYVDYYSQNIKFNENDNNILYLESGKEYSLDIKRGKYPFILKLFPLKSNEESSFDINYINYKENTTLNSSNKYYYPTKEESYYNYYISNITENVFIELLSAFNESDIEILNKKEIKDYIIKKELTLIEYSFEIDKNMEIFIKSEEFFGLGVYAGPTKAPYFSYSKYNDPEISELWVSSYCFKLDKQINIMKLEEGEKYYVSIIINKRREEQVINVTYYYNNNPIEDLYEDLEESYISNVISNLTSIINAYVYLDYSQNPDYLINYTHKPINIINALNNIKRTERKYYEFYREIRQILGTVRDLHFNIISIKTPKGINIDQYTACIPFRFYVDKDLNDNNEIKLYIKYYEDCAVFYEDNVKNFIKNKSKEKIALKYINGIDPFDFIQNWGWNFLGVKNPHGEFTFKKNIIHSFYLKEYPFTPEELNIKYEFDSDDFITLDYFIFTPNFYTINKFYSKSSSNNLFNYNKNEFDKFFKEEMRRYTNNIIKPNIFEILERFRENKGILKEEIKIDKIKWDYQTKERDGIKCKVDKDNQVNIFLQQSFTLDKDIFYAIDTIKNCSQAFYSNTFPIIGIENLNMGGIIVLAELLHQLIQIKTTDRLYVSGRNTELYKSLFINSLSDYANIETCKPFNSIEEFMEGIEDDYSTENETIKHKRTKTFDFATKDIRKEIHERREFLLNNGYKKRPTEIIIFTDGLSFSATSMLIKGFQNTGGAIIVGYNGNPKLSDDLFDASQSPSHVENFQGTEFFNNLFNLGFKINGITASETFSDNFKEKNSKPREYQFDPVDERVDIYNPFTEDDYQLFINKAKDIFKKYNEDKKCNKKNKKLLYDPNDGKTCYKFPDDEFAHGGFMCGEDEHWNDTCQKYYCDIGYYFDTFEKKCKIDKCVNDPQEKEIVLEGEYFETIIINEKNNTEYVFNINTSEYIYFFRLEGEDGYIHYDYNIPCAKLCIVQNPNQLKLNNIHLNYYRNATREDIIVKISSIKIEANFMTILSAKLDVDKIDKIIPLTFPFSFYIIETFVDYVTYFQTMAKNSEVKIAEYNNNMSDLDIIQINEKYFTDCNNKLISIEKNKIYIIAISTSDNFELNKLLKILLQPKQIKNQIEVKEDKTSILYLNQSNKEYILDFSMNYKDRIIQLSRATLNGEIEIKNEQMQTSVTLNSDNLYYTFDEYNKGIFNGKLIIKVNKDALIEFLVDYSNEAEILNEKEYKEYKLKRNTVITFEKNNREKPIYIKIFSKNNKPFKYGMIAGFTYGKYYHYSNYYKFEETLYKYDSYIIEVNLPNITLKEGEYYYLMLFFSQDISDELSKIHLTKSDKFSIDFFNADISESQCNLVIDNMIQLIEEGYAYNDIIKNPPNIEYFGKYNLTEDLKKVEKKDRKYFDFYRDIRRITAQMKDGHFNILPIESPNKYNPENVELCLPFSFYIKGNSNYTAQIYIEIYKECFDFFNQEEQNFINSHLDKPLLSINNKDPFDYIQNLQSEFNSVHNKHAEFSKNLENAHKLSLAHNPFTEKQISNIQFVFDGGDNITLNYYINYKEEKDKTKEIINDDIDLKEWKYSTKLPNSIKCLIDDSKKVNVFKQGSFNFLKEEDYKDALEVIKNCIKEFYNNSYPIVGIEYNSQGESINTGLYFQQLLQIKIMQRTHFSAKISNMTKNEFMKNMTDKINIETCEQFNNYEEMKEVIDDYGDDIKLHRTKMFQILNKNKLKEIKKIREELYKINNLKRPTDIIIFTDGFSFGATSFFIKGLQETGGAIIVGYKGNPKIEEKFDASQSASSSTNFENSDINNNLLKCGFKIEDISFYQSFDYSYQGDKPIPKEYTIFPVDERVNIYQKYNDSLYDIFIQKAFEIFDKYNKNNKCNSNNLLLTYDPNDKKTCYVFDNDKYAHGGYQCGSNGEWTNNCVPYYCDIGYIFDTYNKKCIKDICTEDNGDNNTESKKEGDFPVYAIVLISVGGILILILIGFLLYKFIFSREKIAIDSIGPLEQGIKDADVELAENK